MTKLEELIYSLATVIVRYHDTQRGVQQLVAEIEPTLLRKKSREYAIGIINGRETPFNEQLRKLIDACTKGYPDRLHFLTFILHEIIFLKAQLERKESFKPEELEEYQKQVAQLFKDFTQLLKTAKDKTYKVSYSALDSESNTSIALSGLINNAYFGNEFCNSGLLLIDEVLGRFHMTRASTDDEIKEIAISLCMENQNALLVAELQNQKRAQEARALEPDSPKSLVDSRNLELEAQKATLELQNLELVAQKAKLEIRRSELEGRNLDLESQNSTLESQKLELSDANQAKQKIIDGLRVELATAQSKLTSMQSDLENKQRELEEAQTKQTRTVPSYPLFGLAALSMFNRTKGFGGTSHFFNPQLTQSPHKRDDEEDFGPAL